MLFRTRRAGAGEMRPPDLEGRIGIRRPQSGGRRLPVPVRRSRDMIVQRSPRLEAMARVVVDVMPKPEILDPQGKAVTGALGRLGFHGIAVRQGKRFELEVDGE